MKYLRGFYATLRALAIAALASGTLSHGQAQQPIDPETATWNWARAQNTL
jgi:hypothetical protein